MSNSLSPLTAKLADLIALPTMSQDAAAASKAVDFLTTKCQQHDLQVDRLERNGFPSLVATTQGSKQPKLLLQAHIDVVPAKPHGYALRQQDGKLYGRGVFDMKFAAACYLQLVEELKEELSMYDFGLMFTSDEEIGGQDGVAWLLDHGYGAEVCILPDGGNDWQLETVCNGAWQIALTALGKTAHGSRPWEGENAISRLMDGLSAVSALFGEPQPGESTLTISQISGGEAINQVPDNATATLDIRFPEAEDYDRLTREITAIAEQHQLDLTTVTRNDVCRTDVTQPHVARFIELAEQLRGKPLGTCRSYGGSDARFFAKHNIPTIVIRPNGGGAHSDDEWIDETELAKFYEVIKAYIVETAKIA